MEFTRSSGRGIPVTITTNFAAPKVRVSYDRMLVQYQWDYRRLIAECKKRYSDFRIDNDFYALKEELEQKEQYVWVRQSDPNNPRSSKKKFYSPRILNEIDRTYKRCKHA